MTMRALVFVILGLRVSLATPALTLGAPKPPPPVWRYEAAGVGVPLLSGWEWWDQAAVREVNNRAGTAMGAGAPFYVRGASSKKHPDRYLLIQITPLSGRRMTYEQLERELGVPLTEALNATSQSLSDTVSDLSLGSGTLDRARNRITLRIDMTASGRPLSGITFGYLTSSHIVFVHCYAPTEQFAIALPELETMSNAVTVDTGFEFKPAATGSIGHAALRGAIIGGAIGAVGMLLKKLRGKSATAK